MYSCLQEYNKLNKSHLVGQLLNSIHDARTHVYKICNKYLHPLQRGFQNVTMCINRNDNTKYFCGVIFGGGIAELVILCTRPVILQRLENVLL